MHWMDRLMQFTEILPHTPEEKLTAGADALGLTMTTIWLAGLNHASVDTWLHTAIAVVTFASVSFSLCVKITNYLKNRNEQDS